MEEIKVGEYIRNNEGFIGKIEKIIYDKQEAQNYYSCEKHNVMASGYIEQIVKHSKNIIDLIEEGDYVNGKIVTEIKEWKSSKEGFFRYAVTTDYEIIRADEIKSIVTKEQFKSLEYIVEGR